MHRRVVIVILIAVVACVAILVTRPWVFFQTTAVDEAFPFDDMTEEQQTALEEMPDEMRQAFMEMAQDDEMNQEMVKQTAVANLEPAGDVSEEPMDGMEDETLVLGRGEFGRIDAIHAASGTATIYALPDGRRVVRLEDFESTNGPELHVILTAGTEKQTFASVGDYVDLGILKGNQGNQNYEIPDDVDLEPIKSVVIYCRPFKVVFSVADLQ